jgi:Kef-type K+ transport system membrane component KefB
MDAKGLDTLLVVVLIAALAPMLSAAIPRMRIPQVVIFIVCGILIGSHGLGLADTSSIKLLSNVGLGFLFLLAGYELDPLLLREQAGKLAMLGWVFSAVIAVGVVALFGSFGYVHDFVPIGLAFTTTALGTLLPILSDNNMLSGPFGRFVLAAGAVGELFPILAISLFLSDRGEFVALISIACVCVVAILLTVLPRIVGEAKLRTVVEQGRRATAQTTLRLSIVLLLLLLVAAQHFGLDAVLGAMLAGIVLRTWTRRMDVDVAPLEEKLDAVGYGFFIPIFFVTSGMTLDIQSIAKNPIRLIVFFVLLLVVRGLPCLLVYRNAMPARQRVEMTFITATTMPLLIALAEIGLSDGVMVPANAAAMVGAGVLSVLVFPSVAAVLSRPTRGVSTLPADEVVVVTEAREAGEPGEDGATTADP